ncbi:Myblike DNAbinding domain-containing protein, partial [Quaeritorhiza haematococci]
MVGTASTVAAAWARAVLVGNCGRMVSISTRSATAAFPTINVHSSCSSLFINHHHHTPHRPHRSYSTTPPEIIDGVPQPWASVLPGANIKRRPLHHKRRWSPREKSLLLEGIRRFGPKWTRISATLLPHRSPKACRDQFVTALYPDRTNDPWSSEEDARLMKVVREHGARYRFLARHFFPRRLLWEVRDRHQVLEKERTLAAMKGEERIIGLIWTPEKDKKLLDLVTKFGKKWTLLMMDFPGNTPNDLMCRWNYLSTPRTSEGAKPWTPEEDALILRGFKRFGKRLGYSLWDMVSKVFLPHRPPMLIATRWHSALDPSRSREPFTAEEDAVIKECWMKYGGGKFVEVEGLSASLLSKKETKSAQQQQAIEVPVPSASNFTSTSYGVTF